MRRINGSKRPYHGTGRRWMLVLAALGLIARARWQVPVLLAGALWLSASQGACATSSDERTDSGHGPGDEGATSASGDHGPVTALAIDPASSTLTVTDPTAPPTAELQAIATFADDTTAPVAASWSVDRFDIAAIGGATGVVTPTGATFGVATVTATAMDQTATATVTIKLDQKLNLGNVATADQSALDAATRDDPAVTSFAYPYDGTVFPRGLFPPEQMWNGGAQGDLYALRFIAPYLDLTVYLAADPPSRFTLPAGVWDTITTSTPAADVSVELRRLSGSSAYLSAKQSWHIADANLRGIVYYWAIQKSGIYKIDVQTGSDSPLLVDPGANTEVGSPMPLNSGAPASPPWQNNGKGKRCFACHSVSKDGSTLTAVVARANSLGPVSSVDLASSSIKAIADYQTNSGPSAVTPDGKRAVVNFFDKKMQLLDTSSAQPIASALDGQVNLAHPAFSPDGSKLALAANVGPYNTTAFISSDLVIYSYGSAPPYFTNLQTVVAGNGAALAYPSFSPDSQLLFFQGGNGTTARYKDPATGAELRHLNDIFVVAAKPNATPVALANANDPGGVLPSDSKQLNTAPTVNPIAEGGYIWVVFTSLRDYGNRMAAVEQNAAWENRRQLWVTAVDPNLGTTDPSHPPFWLPGQDLASHNMFGYWTLSPCKPTVGDDGGPQTCSAGYECCSGFCHDTGDGPVCVDNPGGCHQIGDQCTTASDCCGDGVECTAGFCQQSTPK